MVIAPVGLTRARPRVLYVSGHVETSPVHVTVRVVLRESATESLTVAAVVTVKG